MADKVSPSGSFINSWLVCGTFENDTANTGFHHDYIGEAQIKPSVQMVTAGKAWRYFDDRLFSRNYDDYQDLFSYFKTKRRESVAAKVVYAHVYVFSPKQMNGELRLGANNEVKAWMNGKLVMSSETPTPYRDTLKCAITLRIGWNSLLLKIANRENGRYGFYARICDSNGKCLPNLTYSTGGDADTLAIGSQAMDDIQSADMPAAFREWPYVEADPLNVVNKRNHQLISSHTDIMLHSSPFQFAAQGGTPPYRWRLVSGSLPPGLRLDKEGIITGTVPHDAKLGYYVFKVEVVDSKGYVASRSLAIKLNERPNRWYETEKLVGLMHAPEKVADDQIPRLASLMKAEGYGVGIPISYDNGDYEFRWPSSFDPDRVDTIGKYKAALEAVGLKFGMYMGNIAGPNVGVNNGILMVEEAMRRYHPKVLWFDWGADVSGYESIDALYSMVKSIDPETVIVKNGFTLLYHGDWDVLSLEGFWAWGKYYWSIWPSELAWPKKSVVESWRLITDPKWDSAKDILPDWKVYMRVVISMIGEGQVANLDHSATLVTGLEGDGMLHRLEDSPISLVHINMAAWANTAGKPSLTESYIKVDSGPLDGGAYGYNTINLSRDVIYVHMLQNPFGRTGMPKDSPLVLTGVKQKVTSIIWMNGNKPLKFMQAGRRLTVSLTDVTPDEVDTILKIKLHGAHPHVVAKPYVSKPVAVEPLVPAGNLAYFKPAKLLSNDGITELEPSNGLNEAKFGVDGDLDTVAQGSWEWAWTYQVDLLKSYNIRTVRIQFSKTCWATEYKLLVSKDGTKWSEIAHVADGKGGTVEHTSSAQSARYIRVTSLKPDGPGQTGAQMGITDLQVFE